MPYISVHIDTEDVIDCLDDLTEKELLKLGYCRLDRSHGDAPGRNTSIWHDVRQTMLQHDQRRINDLLAQLAWDQAGVILPDGVPLVH